jgi:hypothetical protein
LRPLNLHFGMGFVKYLYALILQLVE